MKTLTQYREDIRNLMKKASDIDAKATMENRDLLEAELALKNEILDTVEDLTKTVQTMERQDRMSAILDTPQTPLTVEKNHALSVHQVADKNKDSFSSLGQQMAAVFHAGQPGGKVDPRLFNAASGLNETVPSEGGLR